MLSEESKSQLWGFTGTLLWGALIAIIYIIVQSIVILIYAKFTYGRISDDVISRMEFDGNALSLAAFATLIVCGLMICGVIKR